MTKPGASDTGAARSRRRERVVLDTSAYSHLRAGNDEILDWVATARSVMIPVIVLGELDAAFRRGRRTRENQQMLREFLEEPMVSVLLVTPDVAGHYGRLIAELRQAGTPIPINDVWIAATTVDSGGHLLTFDRDFERVRGLGCTVFSASV